MTSAFKSDSTSIHALIVAAGAGSRFGSNIPKQYTKIQGKTILQYSVAALAKSKYINQIRLVVAKNDTVVSSLKFALPIQLTIGGAERWQSVQAGVEAIANNGAHANDLVLIHDAARPCIDKAHIDAVIKVAQTQRYGAILGVPVADTLKQVRAKAQSEAIEQVSAAQQANDCSKQNVVDIIKTIPRDNLWQAQTPQVFRLGALQEVLQEVTKQQLVITDEASAFEYLGYPLKLVEGSRHNVKLTYQEDLQFIKTVLSH